MARPKVQPGVADDHIEALRRFNRLYTQKIGALDEGHLGSGFALIEVRVLYELTTRRQTTARDLQQELGIDAGYLSRILTSFQKRGFMSRRASPEDGRRMLLAVTARGRRAFAPLDVRACDAVRRLMAPLTPETRALVVGAAQTIHRALAGADRTVESPLILRAHRPGDMGWVVERHGTLYAQEYGWDERFEALVADLVARFIQKLDPRRERCWIAELDGARVGCVFLVRETARVARLRMLLVEPTARGHGLGRHLVNECVRFAREAGYSKITLWTNDILHAARRIYQHAGFELIAEKPHDLFGKGLVGQTWDLDLRRASKPVSSRSKRGARSDA
jgi:DNA-binding MarR family transcriptional regulator/GNAT superfamily N-acetyltransferase